MISRTVKLQLLVFALVTGVVLWYGAVRLLGLGDLVNRPYTISVQVADPGGLYPRADVDLLGTRVGKVTALRPGPGRGTTVEIALEDGTRIPRDVRAIVGSKSAIGEGYVELEPQSAGAPYLEDGDVVALADTVSPPRLDGILAHLDALARSVPTDDLATLLDESALAVDGIAPSVGRLIDSSDRLARTGLRSVDDLTALIRDARTVLDTQVALGPQTRTWARELAKLTGSLRAVDPQAISLYDTGLRASTEVTNLLDDNQRLLPVLLGNLVDLTDVAGARIQGLRKTLTVFPWVLQNGVNTTRHCDDYDIETGEPVESTCHYDSEGNPIYTLHLSQQLDKLTGNPYQSCVRGYETTRRFRPDGTAVDGGARERRRETPNLTAHCAAPPTDPVSPSVRGAQNVTTPAFERPGWSPVTGEDASAAAVWDPSTGLIASGDAIAQLSGMRGPTPPTGAAGLAWLLTSPFASLGAAR